MGSLIEMVDECGEAVLVGGDGELLPIKGLVFRAGFSLPQFTGRHARQDSCQFFGICAVEATDAGGIEVPKHGVTVGGGHDDGGADGERLHHAQVEITLTVGIDDAIGGCNPVVDPGGESHVDDAFVSHCLSIAAENEAEIGAGGSSFGKCRPHDVEAFDMAAAADVEEVGHLRVKGNGRQIQREGSTGLKIADVVMRLNQRRINGLSARIGEDEDRGALHEPPRERLGCVTDFDIFGGVRAHFLPGQDGAVRLVDDDLIVADVGLKEGEVIVLYEPKIFGCCHA